MVLNNSSDSNNHNNNSCNNSNDFNNDNSFNNKQINNSCNNNQINDNNNNSSNNNDIININNNSNNNNNQMNDNNNNSSSSSNEKLFWDVFHNKILFKIIFNFIKRTTHYSCQYNCIPLHSLDYLIDNNLIDIIKFKVLQSDRMVINSNSDKKKLFKHRKLFKAISSIKDAKFYKNLFNKYLKYFIQYDFDKVIDAIYETDNSMAIESLYKSFGTLIDQNRLYSVDKISQNFDYFLSSYHSFKVSTFILRKFYNHQQNNLNYIKQKDRHSMNLTNNNNPLLIYNPKHQNNSNNSNNKKLNNNRMSINYSNTISDNKIITLDLIWNSIMNTLGKDKEILILDQQKEESINNNDKDKKDNSSNSNNNNNNNDGDILEWPIIFKKYFKFINLIVNELNILPPIQNFKFFSPESWRLLMSTLYSQCPFDSNFKVKWLLEACKAIHSISFYIHEKECIEISKKNGGGYLRINYILNKSQVYDMVFSKYELNQRLPEVDLLNPSNDKVVRLLRSYLEVSRLSPLYSKSIHYYCLFGNDDFQSIEFTSSTSGNNKSTTATTTTTTTTSSSSSSSSSSTTTTTNNTTNNSLRVNKYLFINSFKYAKYELLREYLLKSNEKEPGNYIISTLQEELDKELNNNNNNNNNSNSSTIINYDNSNNDNINSNKKSNSILFKYNNHLDQQLQFIYQFYNHLLLNENIKSTHKINVSFLFSLIISTDNINLINKSVELFKELIIKNTSTSLNNSNNNNLNHHSHSDKITTSTSTPTTKSILNNYNNLFLYTKSSQTLIHLFELFNYQNYNTKELLNYQIFYFNGRLDLLALYEQLNSDNKSKLKFTSLKELGSKLTSKQYEYYLSACRYALMREETYDINLKDTVLCSNYCKERFTTSKDIDNIKFIIQNTKESYRPLELVSHSPGAINLPIAKFYSWLLKERSNDIDTGRCHVNKAEYKLLQYYANRLLPLEIPYTKFISDSKLVFEAIASSSDFNTFNKITSHYSKDNPKIIDQHQSVIKSFVELGDTRVVGIFNWQSKFYYKTMVKCVFYNDHIHLAMEVFRCYSFSDTTLNKRMSNKYSTLDFKKIYKDFYYNLN